MRSKLSAAAFLIALPLLFATAGATALGSDLRFEVQLLWGTNEAASPDPKHKAVDPDIGRKLKALPLKWSNYFEVNRKTFEVAPSSTNSVSVSQHCGIEVKSLGRSKIEVSQIGKGKLVWKGTQSLPKGDVLVLGGNAPSSSSWLVVLKRIE